MTGMKLTERQKRFAEENHKVLEDFLRYRGLPQEEFYDVVVFRFLRAVKQYDERVNVCEEVCETLCREPKRRRIYHISPYSALQVKQGSQNAPTQCTFWERGAVTKRAEAFAS